MWAEQQRWVRKEGKVDKGEEAQVIKGFLSHGKEYEFQAQWKVGK